MKNKKVINKVKKNKLINKSQISNFQHKMITNHIKIKKSYLLNNKAINKNLLKSHKKLLPNKFRYKNKQVQKYNHHKKQVKDKKNINNINNILINK